MASALTDPTQEFRDRTLSTVHEIYRPILRGYFAVFATYYLIMSPINVVTTIGFEMVVISLASSIAAVTGLFGTWLLRKPVQAKRVECLLLWMNSMVIANIAIALNIAFEQEKLTYFIIASMLFALASVSFRQALVSIGICGAVFLIFVQRIPYEATISLGYLSFAGAMASLAIAFFLRKAIVNIAEAKIETERELTKARAVGEEMREKSLSDSLTQLPNRRAFFAELRRVLSDQNNGKSPDKVWLILLDLDGFKAVNDIHGHLTGDNLLQQVAGRLERFVDHQAHVSRMGGDEFNLIIVTREDEAHVLKKCQELLDLLSANYIIDGRQVRVSCSMGCKLLDVNESSRTQINQADFALMSAKKQGKNRVVVFDDAHAERAAARFKIESALREADLEKELTLLYQPQLDLKSSAIFRAEVLSRWCSPSIGSVAPEEFINIAEESGLIADITLLVVNKAFSDLIKWPEPFPLAINLSSLDLISDAVIDQVIDAAARYSIDPQLIEFEVTESAMLADFEKASANLRRLSKVGFTIALDDFGTGYSNFNYLRVLPINKLKVDRSLLENPGDPMTEKILISLVGMARALGVHCLLEGVEDELDLLTAKRVGAGSIQGYWIARPMNALDLHRFVTQEKSGYECRNVG